MKIRGNIKFIRSLIIVGVCGIFMACSPKSSKDSETTNDWAIRLADAVMTRNDSLAIYNNPSSIQWNFSLGMLGQAIAQLADKDPRYYNYNKNYIDLFVQADGTILTYDQQDYNLDNFCPAKSLIDLYEETGQDKYLLAIRNVLHQLQMQPRTGNGGYCHKAIYDHQIWLNSAYMLEPFLAQYAAVFNEPQWFDTVAFQLNNIYQLTVDESDGLMVHAWDENHSQSWADPKTGKSPNKWGRGMGWYAMGLVDALEFFPEDHPQRETLVNILQNVSKALLKVRDKETGLWYQILDKGDREYNYIETSASAMFIYVFAKGADMGVLPARYKELASQLFQSLVDRYIKTDVDHLPTLTHVSGSAGLGVKLHRDGSFEYYINQQQVDNDAKGMAPLIFAAIEMNK